MNTVASDGFIKDAPASAEAESMAKHLAYRPDIDGLRAVAVLSVIAFHAFPNFIRGGFIGVDIFFIISGYLISGIILQGLNSQTFSLADFYGRRIKRIFPALVLVLIACWLFGWYVLMRDEYQQLGEEVAAGAGFVSNILLWSDSGYFDNAAANKPLLHLWSLGVEEQFYICWPLLLLMTYRRRFNLLILICAVLAISFIVNAALVVQHPVAAYYLPFMRFWELLMGSLLAYINLRSAGKDSPPPPEHCRY